MQNRVAALVLAGHAVVLAGATSFRGRGRLRGCAAEQRDQ
jgi:hypothetical protein